MKYQYFFIRMGTLIGMVAILFGYNTWVAFQDQKAEIHALKEVSNESKSKSTSSQGIYLDGTYKGQGQGFGGIIEVKVQIKEKKIETIKITSADKEDKAYLDMAKQEIEKIIVQQSWEVDTISGATYSSNGIKDGVKKALEKAGGTR